MMKISGFLATIAVLLLAMQGASAYVISGNVSQATLGPVNGAIVDVLTMADVLQGTGTTDAFGNYSIDIPALPPAAYKVSATYSIHNSTLAPLINADIVVDFTLSAPLVALSGTVTDACTGLGIANATISVKKGAGQLASATATLTGTYTVDVIDNTTYDVTASAVGYIYILDSRTTKSVTMAGAPVTQDFALWTVAETCNGIDDDCSGTVDDGLVAPLNTLKVGVCLNSVQSCGGAAGWADDYSTVANYNSGPDSTNDGLDDDCDGSIDEDYSAPAPPAPATPTTGGGGGGGGGGGTRGDADCKPAPVGLGIGVSGWLCAENETCIGGITWNSPHVEGRVCCNIQCTTVAAVEEETPLQEEQPAPVETPRETTNPACNDMNPCTIDTYDTVLEVCNNRAAENDTACYTNGQKGVCDFGTCKVPGAPVTPAAPTGPTGFAVFGDFFAAISGAIGAFVQWILGLFG